MNTRSFRRDHLLICALLLAVTIATYWRLPHCGFVSYDDGTYVTRNAWVQSGLTVRGVEWAFGTKAAANWHPVTWISHMVDCRLWGMNPAGHHLTSLLLHLVNTLLLFLILSRITGSRWRSGFVAVLFAVHPLHVQSVAWAAERKDVLSAFFWLLTVWAYVGYTKEPTARRYLPVALFLALGLMSKPMLVTLPIVLLLLDFWPLRRLSGDTVEHSLRLVILEKIPLCIMAAASCVITFAVQRSGGAVASIEVYPLSVRIANAVVSYAGYLVKTVWPAHLCYLYPHPGTSLPVWQVVGSSAAILLLTVLAIRLRHSRPYLLVGWLWYLIVLVPVIGLVQVGGQASADRYTYIPLIGIFTAAAWVVPGPALCSANRVRVLAGCGAFVVMIMAALASQQVVYWQDDISLYSHALQINPNHAPALFGLGLAMYRSRNYERAVEYYRRSISVTPLPEAYCGLAIVLDEQGRRGEALRYFYKAFRLAPHDVDTLGNLGLALSKRGRPNAAVRFLSDAVKVSPDDPALRNNLASALAAAGRYREAVSQCERILRCWPDNGTGHATMGFALDKMGDANGAVDHYRQALESGLTDPTVHWRLGLLLLNAGRLDEAIVYFQRVTRTDPDFANAHFGLAVAMYRKGRYADSWDEVRLCREKGVSVNTAFLKDLSRKLPDPKAVPE